MEPKSSLHFSLPSYVLKALHLLTRSGYEAYAVGGAVRDLLRGEVPHDYDIATSATPEEMMRVFEGFRTVETGIKHGTLTVLVEGEALEVTTYRVDGAYTDSRHPDSVSFTRSLREDAARRDFTVNAMAYHPEMGLRDFFGGQEDLQRGILRTVGESRLRFTEDALRILRALRFASVLGYEIEASTSSAIHTLKGHLREVAPERVREELLKLITAPYAEGVLREYADVIYVVMPEIGALVGFDQKNPHHDFDVWEHTLRALSASPTDSVLRLALLFHDMGKPSCFALDEEGVGHFYGHAEKSAEIAEGIMRRLRFDNETRERVLRLVRMHDVLPLPETRQFARLRSKHGEGFLFDWLALIRADRTGQKMVFSPLIEAPLIEAEAAAKRLIEVEERFSLKTLSVRGDDLFALGYRGKEIGEALERVLSAVIDEKIKNEKSDILEFLKKEQSPPIECERKFLIRRPDLSLLLSSGAKKSDIVQTYLMAEIGTTARVRMRTSDTGTKYTHTVKRRINALSAFEDERVITEAEYNLLLKGADPSRRPIQKTRYVLPYDAHFFEIDIYPFWEKQAVMEVELSSEEEAFSIPPVISVIREVTSDRAYKNISLSKVVPPEDKIEDKIP